MGSVLFKIWVSAKLPKLVWRGVNLPKLAQICKKFAQKPCTKAGKILPKHYISLPNYREENTSTSFDHNQIHFSMKLKKVFTQWWTYFFLRIRAISK